MGAIVMVAANEGINHETGYGHEHEKQSALERHYIPASSSIRDSPGSGGWKFLFCLRCIMDRDEMPKLWPCSWGLELEVDTWLGTAASVHVSTHTIRASETSKHTSGLILEAEQFRAPLDLHAIVSQPFDVPHRCIHRAGIDFTLSSRFCIVSRYITASLTLQNDFQGHHVQPLQSGFDF
jgi:hypothetical protein